jgi:hypothetical protein
MNLIQGIIILRHYSGRAKNQGKNPHPRPQEVLANSPTIPFQFPAAIQ